MKLKTKRNLFLILILFIVFSRFYDSNIRFSFQVRNNTDSRKNKNSNLKNSEYWKFTGSPIFIDGFAQGINAHNWSWAVNQDWCHGNGTYEKPYIIENVTINCQNSGNGLYIQNSSSYIIIKNCTIYNSGPASLFSEMYAGIKLENVNNSKIIENNCSSNNGHGIFLVNCNNNTIYGNNASYNNDISIPGSSIYGIYLKLCNNNTLSNNMVNNNSQIGIMLDNSMNNTILENIANYNVYGIMVSSSNNNYIRNNTLKYNSGSGMYIINCNFTSIIQNRIYFNFRGIKLNECNNNSIIENLLAKNSFEGIYLTGFNNTLEKNKMFNCGIVIGEFTVELSSNKIQNSNLVNEKPLYYYVNKSGLGAENFVNAGQVILINCNNSHISDLDISYGSIGICLILCYNNTIFNNNASNNNKYGISLFYSHNNTISENCANFMGISNLWPPINFLGLFLYLSNNNTITKNTANYNADSGLAMGGCNNNTIFGNFLEHNEDYGIDLKGSNNNTFIKNNLNHNGVIGLELSDSNNNTITLNEINYNEYGIYLRESNSSFIVENCMCGNNISIFQENCRWNIIINNFCRNNDKNNIESGNDDDDEGNSSGEENVISLGIFFLIFLIISIFSLIFKVKLKIPRKS